MRENTATNKAPVSSHSAAGSIRLRIAAASTPNGLLKEAKSSSGPGLSARLAIPSDMLHAATQPTLRHREETNRPVGNRRSSKTKGKNKDICIMFESHADV